MPSREADRLTARKVETLKGPGVYMDGDGLRLVVDANGNKRWRFRFRQGGKTREIRSPRASMRSASQPSGKRLTPSWAI